MKNHFIHCKTINMTIYMWRLFHAFYVECEKNRKRTPSALEHHQAALLFTKQHSQLHPPHHLSIDKDYGGCGTPFFKRCFQFLVDRIRVWKTRKHVQHSINIVAKNFWLWTINRITPHFQSQSVNRPNIKSCLSCSFSYFMISVKMQLNLFLIHSKRPFNRALIKIPSTSKKCKKKL